MKKNKFWMDEDYKQFIKMRDCGNADHLTGENGEFVSTFPRTPGTMSIGHLEEACQWTYYRKDLTYDEKMEKLLVLEGLIQKLLGDINYHPTWSIKLHEEKYPQGNL